MKNIFPILSICFASLSALFAQEANSDLQTTVEISQGYRRDKLDLKFEVPFKGYSSDIRTKAKNIDIYSTHLNAKVTKGDYFLKGDIEYGSIYDGKYHIQSYKNNHVNHRSQYEKHGKIHDDYTADFVLNFGKNFTFDNGWSIAPTIGYGVYLQRLSFSKGHFHAKHSYKDPYYGTQHSKKSGKGMSESYRTTWYSPQIGFDLQKKITNTLRGFLNYAFLFPMNFQGKVHFKNQDKHRICEDQENKAYKSFGHVASAGIEWKFANAWSLKPEVDFFKFYSKGGDAGHYLNFKKATRTTYEARLSLGYAF